jgi:hypothetical protein
MYDLNALKIPYNKNAEPKIILADLLIGLWSKKKRKNEPTPM